MSQTTRALLSALATAVALLLNLSQPSRAQAPARGRETNNSESICGPLCVKALLDHYGKPAEDVTDLIREIQWPDIAAGSTLRAIGEALSKRGIYSQAMQIGPEARLSWPHPVLLHLKEGGKSGGHYVIWAPPEDPDNERIWMGPSGWRRGPWNVIAGDRSGIILLTSPVPITHPLSAVYDPTQDFRWAFGSLVVSALVWIVLGSLLWRGAVRPRVGIPRVTPGVALSGPAPETRTH
jgi:peptidase C39-like protein